jgi:hypothetical protein
VSHTIAPPRSFEHHGELYHHYGVFGYTNSQPNKSFVINQKCKQPIITAYISHAIAKAQEKYDSDVSFLEMFCADGFFAMLARRLGATQSMGLDSNRDHWGDKSQAVANELGLDNVRFVTDDANNVSNYGPFDIIANVGGLYHVPNPEEILLASHRNARKFLIVQTVVSMANDDPNYFETPAPGWPHGSRFNRRSFDRMIRKHGFNVIDHHFNVLEGNERPEDRGSTYYLIDTRPAKRKLFGLFG